MKAEQKYVDTSIYNQSKIHQKYVDTSKIRRTKYVENRFTMNQKYIEYLSTTSFTFDVAIYK